MVVCTQVPMIRVIFCYNDLLLQLTCLTQLMVQRLHWMELLRLTSMVRIATCSTYTMCTCSLFIQSFPDKCPSDVGVLGILKHIPQWYDLAVKLGVPIAQVEAYKSNPTTGGNQALSYWRNGLCGQQFPTTWGFLLETVDNLHGPRVAEKLRDEAERDKTWSQS